MEKVFLSRLNALPLDMKCELGEVPLQKGMQATSRKNEIIKILKKYGIDFLEIGTGTNRFIIKYDGFAIKIALDHEGIADNRQEWVMTDLLKPNVAISHEISSGGHLLVATYAPAFTSYLEMNAYQKEIRAILEEWSGRFLLGDVGLCRENYANWGLLDGRPVCIDYAYIFPAGMDFFKCHCGSHNMIPSDTRFSGYRCQDCGKLIEDREIRARISAAERMELFHSVEGFVVTEEKTTFDVPASSIKSYDPADPDMNLAAMEMVLRYPKVPEYE